MDWTGVWIVDLNRENRQATSRSADLDPPGQLRVPGGHCLEVSADFVERMVFVELEERTLLRLQMSGTT